MERNSVHDSVKSGDGRTFKDYKRGIKVRNAFVVTRALLQEHWFENGKLGVKIIFPFTFNLYKCVS